MEDRSGELNLPGTSFATINVKQEKNDLGYEYPNSDSEDQSLIVECRDLNNELQAAIDSITIKRESDPYLSECDDIFVDPIPVKTEIKTEKCDVVKANSQSKCVNENKRKVKNEVNNSGYKKSKKKKREPASPPRRSKYKETSSDTDVTSSEDESGSGEDNTCEKDEMSLKFRWDHSVKNEDMNKFKLVKENKMRVPVPKDPYEYFRLFVDDDLLSFIVNEINRAADNILSSTVKSGNSRISQWKNITPKELMIFIGLILHTGTVQMSSIEDYWKTHYLFEYTGISRFMTRNRFSVIITCLNSITADDEFCHSKLTVLMNHFNNKMNKVYHPGRELMIHDGMVITKRDSFLTNDVIFRRYVCGIKLVVLAEPDGTIVKYLLTAVKKKAPGHITPQNLVSGLLEDHLNKGHSVYLTERYNSCHLAQFLYDYKTNCTGRLTKGLQGTTLEKVKLKKHENRSIFRNGMHVGKWRNKHDEWYISSEYGEEMVEITNRKGIKILKPAVLVNLDSILAASRFQEKMTPYYPLSQFKGKKSVWFKIAFIHTLQMYMTNAYNLYQKFNVGEGKLKMSIYDFRLYILEKLLPEVAKGEIELRDHKLVIIKKYNLCKRQDVVSKEVKWKHCCGMQCMSQKRRKCTMYECKHCPGTPGYCTDCFSEDHEK